MYYIGIPLNVPIACVRPSALTYTVPVLLFPSIASFAFRRTLLVLQGDVVRFLLRLRTSLITVYNDDYADPTRDPGSAPVRWFAGSRL